MPNRRLLYYIALMFCAFVLTTGCQNKTIRQQRRLIREMVQNPTCLVENN